MRRPSIRRIARELRPHRGHAIRGVAASVLASAAASTAPLVVGLAVDEGIVRRDGRALVLFAGLFLLANVVQAAFVAGERRAMGRLAHRSLADMRRRVIDKVLRRDLDGGREDWGAMLSRLTADVENLEQFLTVGISLIFQAGVALVLTLALMVTQSPRLTLVTLAVVPPLVAVTAWFNSRSFVAQVTVRDRVANLLGRLNEYIVGMRVAQAFAIEDQHRVAFEEMNQDTYRAKMRTSALGSVYYASVELLQPLALLLVIWAGAELAADGAIAVGTVVAFTLYAGRLFQPIEQFAELAHLLLNASASFAKLFALLDEPAKVEDMPGAEPLRPGPGRVRFEGVSFRYHPEGPDVVADLDLVVEPGERVALVGPSGTGKSTLGKLVVRFLDPPAGRILVDDQDVRRVTQESLRRAVALVPQEGFLFEGTVVDNIAVVRPEATIEDIEEVCRSMGFLDALRALPAGLQTRVTDGGQSLSAGQRQMVALARTLLASPSIVVLDEATSNLDPATAAAVERGLARLLAGRTAIIIAHRLEAAFGADRVVVLDAGRVVASGTPRELLRCPGAFRSWTLRQRTLAHASLFPRPARRQPVSAAGNR